MKTLIKIVLMILVGGALLFFGSYVFIMYQSRSTKEIIEERFHANGNIAMRKIEGNYYREGSYEKTINYDEAGREIGSYGNYDWSRFKEVFLYDDSTLIFEGYYEIYNDSLAENFEVDSTNVDLIDEAEYYLNGKVKSIKQIGFYNWSDRDTAFLDTECYDLNGNVTLDREYRKDRNHFWDEEMGRDTLIVQISIIEDKIKNTIDTIEIKEIRIQEKSEL